MCGIVILNKYDCAKQYTWMRYSVEDQERENYMLLVWTCWDKAEAEETQRTGVQSYVTSPQVQTTVNSTAFQMSNL